MKFIKSRLETNIDRNVILPYYSIYRDFVEEGVFVIEDFCLLIDSPYPVTAIRSRLPQDNLLYGADRWELNCYNVDNPQFDAKDKFIPPNNLFGLVCSKQFSSKDLSNLVTDSIISLFKDKNFYKNENNELYVDGLKVMGCDTFQKTDDSGNICSSMLFFLLLSDISSYSSKIEAMAKKSRYGSIYDRTISENKIAFIKDALITNMIDGGAFWIDHLDF